MIHHRILFAAGLGLLLGCSGAGTAPAGDIARSVHEVAITSGEPRLIADLSIEGMTCEQMCGGAIKKALAQLGVDGVEIRMSEGDGPDHAVVTYDEAKVGDARMVEAIQALNDGQYRVVAIDITRQVKGGSGDAEPAGGAEGAVSVLAPELPALPSIVALIGRLLRI